MRRLRTYSITRPAALTLAMAATAAGVSWASHFGSEDPPPGKKAPTVADLAWIAGHWSMQREGDTLDELWSQPSGTSMMGVFRWLNRDGTVRLFEVLAIVAEGDDIRFRFRHFGPDLTAWEEKDKPLTFKLSRLADGEAVFENGDRGKVNRYVFRRTKDGLTVVVDDAEFAYRRVP